MAIIAAEEPTVIGLVLEKDPELPCFRPPIRNGGVTGVRGHDG
jgi:hypothetical protein